MDTHPFVDAVEDVRVRISGSRRAFARHFVGMGLAPVHSQPKRHREPIVRLIGVEVLEVLVLANQLLKRGPVNNARVAELIID
jgi:hypothetical protein